MIAANPGYCGRFAPSPTGPLHFGSLVAALASCCDARAAGGRWLLRIEDVDLPRARRGADAAILRTLDAYGFGWDGAVVRQSERTALYRAALAALHDARAVYPCSCSRRVLAAAAVGASGERIYPGTCRAGLVAPSSPGSPLAWRLAIEPADAARIAFRDRLQGSQVQDLATDVGDFVLLRADGLFAYQLAVVVDDAAQGVTHVVRGADLLASTPRQIYLQRRLGYPTPSYLHVPVAIDARGDKLSKQTRAAPLPDDALPALLAAWRFLDQPLEDGSHRPASIAEFWQHALARWTPTRLPPVPMLPAPPETGRGVAL